MSLRTRNGQLTWLANALFASAAVLVYIALRPAVGNVLPGTAAAESAATVPIVYQASGAGRLDFAARLQDGTPVADGSLAGSAGAFSVVLPAVTRPERLAVTVREAGPLGHDEKTAFLTVLPRPRLRPAPQPVRSPRPVAVSLAVERQSGEQSSVEVAFTAPNDAAELELRDADGIVWSSQAVRGTGVVELHLPRLTHERRMAVVLSAGKGPASSRSAVTIDVEPASTADEEAIALLTDHVRSDEPIRVQVRKALPGLRLSLADPNGTPILSRIVREPEDVMFFAPRVTNVAQYTVVASYEGTGGNELAVRPVLIMP